MNSIPNIVYVFVLSLVALIAYSMTLEGNLFTVLLMLITAVASLAEFKGNKPQPQQTINAETVTTGDVNTEQEKDTQHYKV